MHGKQVRWTVLRVIAYRSFINEGSERSARITAMKIETERLLLESITPELARRIVRGERALSDRWHAEYPFEDELGPLRSLAAGPAPDPFFTMYLIRRKSDELAVGGFGFRGRPDTTGRIEFGYGLIPAARGVGLATEAVRAALEVAITHGARMAAADTELGNGASRRVLEKAGLIETHRQKGFVFFSRPLFDEGKP